MLAILLTMFDIVMFDIVMCILMDSILILKSLFIVYSCAILYPVFMINSGLYFSKYNPLCTHLFPLSSNFAFLHYSTLYHNIFHFTISKSLK